MLHIDWYLLRTIVFLGDSATHKNGKFCTATEVVCGVKSQVSSLRSGALESQLAYVLRLETGLE